MIQNEKPSVYLETTIPSFVASRPSKDIIIAGRQQVTWQWWAERKKYYALFISQYVLDEILEGDRDASRKRMEVLADIDLLEIDDKVIMLTDTILNTGVFPSGADTDVAHIAIASRHNMDFLITWNCRHIANAEILRKINFIVSEAGYNLPTVCTPDELSGEEDND